MAWVLASSGHGRVPAIPPHHGQGYKEGSVMHYATPNPHLCNNTSLNQSFKDDLPVFKSLLIVNNSEFAPTLKVQLQVRNPCY